MAEFESIVDYDTVLDNFEGPLDLLLHLIKEAKIEIREIFVSNVTEQYLEYVRNMDVLDVDKATEYLTMASTLVEIKSKAILPKIELDEDGISEEEAFFRQVEEYKLFKEATTKLKERENVDRFYKDPDKSIGETKIVYTDFNLDGLVKAFFKLMMKVEERRSSEVENKEIPKEVYTVKDKVDLIRTTLLDRGYISFYELFSLKASRTELITTFQATLELLKLQYIKVEQNEIFGDITLILREDRNEEIGEIDEYN
jgi:segregation and condensation protein A